ncbi:MAG: endolytic transglycosylase MltG [Deltaproteobacteria bacterium]|nr:endolytic transglycosylase MltG [Deltaproteobacteria bacterium]
MGKRIATIVGVFVLLLVGLTAGGYLYLDRVARTPLDASAAPRMFEVPKGASMRRVAQILEKEGFIGNARVLAVEFILNPLAAQPKAGRHEISAAMTGRAIFEKLAENPIPDDVPLTIVEGWRLRDIDAFLSGQKLIEAGAYEAAANDPKRFKIPFEFRERTLEGYLFPETYRVPPGPLDVNVLIQRQIDAFAAAFEKPYHSEIAKADRPLRDLVILASLLEREEPTPSVRPKVAGVLYNRLNAKPPAPLGVDATSRYTLEEWNNRRKFLAKLRDPHDPYNTRLRAGLPPTPIGAPSLPSLLAALRPEPSPYWYYLHDAQKRIHFAKDAKQHEANRRRHNVW